MMIPPKPEVASGEWQTETDKYGATRRYRMIGSVKEYEADVLTTHGTMAKSQLDTYNSTARPAAKTCLDRSEPARTCPFRDGINTHCTGDKCAAFLNGCTLSRGKAGRDTSGLQCPINRYHAPCRTDCALYRNGCTFAATITESEDN